MAVLRGLVYASPGGRSQSLDLYLPADAEGPLPVVVWIHGGWWMFGDKDEPDALPLVGRGFALASINYRLTGEAPFPAQIEDCKAAVRWLRANAWEHGLDYSRIGVWGESAGGHLAALLGTSAGVAGLEGDGGNGRYPSRMRAVCDWYGPVDVTRLQSYPDSPIERFLGGPVEENIEKAVEANPITYIDGHDPPFLILHGDRDDVIPLEQSELLAAALELGGVDVRFGVLEGAGHGGWAFAQPGPLETVIGFFEDSLMLKLAIACGPQAGDGLRIGLSEFARFVSKSGCLPTFVRLERIRGSDLAGFDALFLSDPDFLFSGKDLAALETFLRGGGRCLVLLGQDSLPDSFGTWLEKYGIFPAGQVVADRAMVKDGSILDGPFVNGEIVVGVECRAVGVEAGRAAALLTTGDGAIVGAACTDRRALGAGSLMVVGVAAALEDRRMRLPGNLAFAANLLTSLRNGWDLRVESVSLKYTDFAAEQGVTGRAEIGNLGYAPSQPCEIAFMLAPLVSGGAPPGRMKKLGTAMSGVIAPGRTARLKVGLRAPGGIGPGDYRLVVVVDPRGRCGDPIPENNRAVASGVITVPAGRDETGSR